MQPLIVNRYPTPDLRIQSTTSHIATAITLKNEKVSATKTNHISNAILQDYPHI